jgi:hypothetical protein
MFDAPGVGEGHAATTSRPAIWHHHHHNNLVRIASSLRADMIFGKDTYHYFGRFTHTAARCKSIFGSVDIALQAVERRAREWRDVRRAELAGVEGR